eukprot:scaffold9752_cov103-Isochrysis_galbana.AAC.3
MTVDAFVTSVVLQPVAAVTAAGPGAVVRAQLADMEQLEAAAGHWRMMAAAQVQAGGVQHAPVQLMKAEARHCMVAVAAAAPEPGEEARLAGVQAAGVHAAVPIRAAAIQPEKALAPR